MQRHMWSFEGRYAPPPRVVSSQSVGFHGTETEGTSTTSQGDRVRAEVAGNRSNFDVDLMPIEDLAASASIETLRKWNSVINLELSDRAEALAKERQETEQCIKATQEMTTDGKDVAAATNAEGGAAGLQLQKWDFSLQYCILGASGVGKTALFNRMVEDSFHSDYRPTTATNSGKVLLDIQQSRLQLCIFDTYYSRFAYTYANVSAVALLVYDVTDRRSFENLLDFIDREKARAAKPGESSITWQKSATSIVLVANKCDMNPEMWQVSSEEGRKVGMANGFLYVEV
ncbi:Survival of motor neuron--splicing factor 30, partial [Perkinsus olseni]